ncbi:MAG TPA: membrane protein insertase YidC, partial [Paracoccaceae bacterium]|nr:membrane protein insertase YidC [Paracoccaceae bacterium]
MDEQNKNLLLAAALSFVVILVWIVLFPPAPPQQPSPTVTEPVTTQPAPLPTTPGAMAPSPDAQRSQALTRSERVVLDTPRLSGTVALRGGRIDDLHLKSYREKLEPGSPNVTLLSPTGSPSPYFATFGWLAAADPSLPTPNAETEWRVEGNAKLSESAPVTLVWDNGAGQIFRQTIAVDDHYMFTITQSVENRGTAQVTLGAYGYVLRRGEPETSGFWVLHEGAIAAFDGTSKE